MALPERLVQLLHQAGADLAPDDVRVQATSLASITLVGSLSRDDFRVGGSDVDLLVVHGLGELPSAELGRRPELRGLVRHFGEPLMRAAGHSGLQKPFMIDCHFVDREVLAAQPQWATPETFTADLVTRDRFLWVYAFDLVAHGRVLWGESPVPLVQPREPEAYLALAAADWVRRLAEIARRPVPQPPSEELVNGWKAIAGEMMTLLALRHGCHSLRKQDVHRVFNTGVPYFPGKDFAASLWAEYLYGTVFQDRQEWVARCHRFCHNAAELLG
jgi:hypothetical protein